MILELDSRHKAEIEELRQSELQERERLSSQIKTLEEELRQAQSSGS